MPRNYVIIGSGIGGLAAAEAIRQRDPAGVIRIVSEEKHDYYSRPGLAYLLRGDIPESQLAIRTADDLAKLKVQRVHGRVEQLLPDTQEIVLVGGKRIGYNRLLLATGATAVPAPFYKGELKGLVKLDSLNDARDILKLCGRGQVAVVVGGGITALEIVEGLRARRCETHYFMRSNRYWSDVLDEVESEIVLGRLKHEGVIIHPNTQVESVSESRGRLTGVVTQDGTNFPCDILAVAIGVRPRLELAKQANLAQDRGILVNILMQTSAPNVFAAGDVAQVEDPSGARLPMDVLWPTALVQGRVAGANMAGEEVRYHKSVPFNVTQLAGIAVTIIGAVSKGKSEDLLSIVRGDSESWRKQTGAGVVSTHDDVNRVRLMVGDSTIVGALVMGDQMWSRPLQALVGGRADIRPIRPALVGTKGDALEELALFYQQWLRQRGSSRVGGS
jgi:NADPH-dependent 2,4-dienoyl-CoA reductase/sulfur reductase-like enzyme